MSDEKRIAHEQADAFLTTLVDYSPSPGGEIEARLDEAMDGLEAYIEQQRTIPTPEALAECVVKALRGPGMPMLVGAIVAGEAGPNDMTALADVIRQAMEQK